MCFIYTCFVLQLFEPSIFDLASVLVYLLALSPPLHLQQWHPPLSSVMGFHGRRMTESASSFSHHTSPLVSCSFLILFQICHFLTFIPFTFHSQNLKLLFVLPFVSPLFPRWLMRCILGPVVFPYRGLSLFGGQLSLSAIFILYHLDLQVSLHGLLSHVSITWTLLILYIHLFIHTFQTHHMIFTWRRRTYTGSLKMWLCGYYQFFQITWIIKVAFLFFCLLAFYKLYICVCVFSKFRLWWFWKIVRETFTAVLSCNLTTAGQCMCKVLHV